MTWAARSYSPAMALCSIILASVVAYGWPEGTLFPSGPRWLALALLGLVATLAWRRDRVVSSIEIWAGVLLGWCFLSLLWSPDPSAGYYSALRATALVAVGVGVARAPEKMVRLIPNLAGAGAAIAVILALLWPHSYGGFGNENWITGFLILAVPLSWAGWRPGAALVTVWVAWYLLFVNGSQLEFPAVAGAALATAVAYMWNRSRWGVVGFLVGMAVLTPLLMLVFADSVAARLEIWYAGATLVAQAPLFGHGVGGFDFLLPTVQGDEGRVFLSPFMWANAAHNDFLELTTMAGLIGLGLAVGLVVSLLRAPAPMAIRWTLYSALVLAFGDFPFQQPAAALVIAIAVGLTARSAGRFSVKDPAIGFTARFMLVAAVLLAIIPLADTWRAQALFSKAYIIAGVHPPLAFKTAMEAARIQSSETFIRRHLMLYLANAERWCAHNDKCKATIPHAAADKVYERAVAAGPAFPGLRIARAQYMLNAGRWDEPEMLGLVRGLQERFPRHPETWIVSAWTAERRRDASALIVSFKHLAGLKLNETHKKEIKRLMKIAAIQPNPLHGKI